MDNLQGFPLWQEENHAKKIYQGNGIIMPCGTPPQGHERYNPHDLFITT